jgi:hypothetical protein
LGLTLPEFGQLTPGMFAALRKRRLVEFRYQKYLHGIGASTTHNMHVAQAGSDNWRGPLDYVGVEIKEDKFAELRQNLIALFGSKGSPRGSYQKEFFINRIVSGGRYTKEEVMSLFEEMFPEN